MHGIVTSGRVRRHDDSPLRGTLAVALLVLLSLTKVVRSTDCGPGGCPYEYAAQYIRSVDFPSLCWTLLRNSPYGSVPLIYLMPCTSSYYGVNSDSKGVQYTQSFYLNPGGMNVCGLCGDLCSAGWCWVNLYGGWQYSSSSPAPGGTGHGFITLYNTGQNNGVISAYNGGQIIIGVSSSGPNGCFSYVFDPTMSLYQVRETTTICGLAGRRRGQRCCVTDLPPTRLRQNLTTGRPPVHTAGRHR